MAAVRSTDTTPERVVRSTLHRLGYRYRLHDTRLPGKPDLSFPSRHVAIFVHGCFWHRHPDCRKGAATPVARREYWTAKFARTVTRDAANRTALENNGWTVMVVWECQLRVCAVIRRRFPVGASPTRQPLQPEATGAVMEVTKCVQGATVMVLN